MCDLDEVLLQKLCLWSHKALGFPKYCGLGSFDNPSCLRLIFCRSTSMHFLGDVTPWKNIVNMAATAMWMCLTSTCGFSWKMMKSWKKSVRLVSVVCGQCEQRSNTFFFHLATWTHGLFVENKQKWKKKELRGAGQLHQCVHSHTGQHHCNASKSLLRWGCYTLMTFNDNWRLQGEAGLWCWCFDSCWSAHLSVTKRISYAGGWDLTIV